MIAPQGLELGEKLQLFEENHDVTKPTRFQFFYNFVKTLLFKVKKRQITNIKHSRNNIDRNTIDKDINYIECNYYNFSSHIFSL